jgi:hypothetical protein
MFLDSFTASQDRYRQLLRALREGRLSLRDMDLDTGTRPAPGVNTLADETYADLIDRLEKAKYAGASPGLRRALADHYAATDRPAAARKSASSTRGGTSRIERRSTSSP